jgi:SH3-like domain-containing protein
MSRYLSFLFATLIVAAMVAAPGCGKGAQDQEVLYVSAPQAFLRDRVATIYSKTGTVHNADKVIALEHAKRWVRVRNAQGEEGWLQERNLVGQDVFDGLQQLNKEHVTDPAQVRGVLRNDLRLHVTPARETDRLFMLKEGQKVELLARTSVPKNGLPAAKPAPPNATDQESADDAKDEEKEDKGKDSPSNLGAAALSKSAKPTEAKKNPRNLVSLNKKKEKVIEAPPPVMEDWWLVRDGQGHSGWVLGRMIDVDVPIEIGQYAEAQRVVAFYPLTTVHDSETNKDQPYYLVLLTEPKDGLPFDYNQVRLFSWNLKRHRYETAYRERNVSGFLPVSIGQEDFEKVGKEPTFTLRVRDQQGQTIQQKYRLEGVIVKRVLAPGEQPLKAARSTPGHAKARL